MLRWILTFELLSLDFCCFMKLSVGLHYVPPAVV